jgi:hypothetical protein
VSAPVLSPDGTLGNTVVAACQVCGDRRILMEPDGSKVQPCYVCQPVGITLEQAVRPREAGV